MAKTDFITEQRLADYHDELMKDHIVGGTVFDISSYHATGTPPVLAEYTNLSAALGTNGANVPESMRKGGMSVKFVSSIDNKYVQYRLMSDTFNTTPANWQGVDTEVTVNSKNLVESGGVEKAFEYGQIFNFSKIGAPVGAIMADGSVSTAYSSFHLYSFNVATHRGRTIIVNISGLPDRQGAFCLLRFVNSDNSITKIVLDNTFSSPVIGYKVPVPNNADTLQISSASGLLSVFLDWHDAAQATISLKKYAPIFPNEVNNLAAGSRFIGVLVANGAVSTPDSINTFYIANIAGEYTFADNSSFTLGENEFAIFNFTADGIEKKKILSIDLYEDSEFYDNIIDYSTLTPKKFVNSADGSLSSTTSTAMFASDFIEVNAGEILIVSSSITMWGAFYNSSKQYVPYSLTTNGGGQVNTQLTVPANAKYIRLTVSIANTTLGDEYRTKLYRQKERFKVNPDDISSVEIIDDIDKSYNFITPSSAVLNKRADGGTKTIEDDTTSKYVRFRAPYKAMKFNINVMPSSIAYSIVSNGNTIRGSVTAGLSFDRPSDAASDLYFYLNFPIDTDISELACYLIKANGYHYSMQGLKVPYLEKELDSVKEDINEVAEEVAELNENVKSLRNQWYGKKIVWLGTSIPWGQSDEDNPGTTTRVAHPYPQQVCDALGATLIDSTHGGLAQQAAYDDVSGKWYPKPYSAGGTSSGGSTCLTIAECQAAYAAGLVNADLSAYSYENTLLGKNADLYIFDVEPNNNGIGSADDLELFDWRQWKYTDNSTFASHRNTYIGALIYEIDLLLTEKPDAIIVFIGEFITMNLQSYNVPYSVRIQSEALCDKFHIGYINIAKKLNYNGKNKSVWVNSDNVHPKAAAYNRMAKMLINELLLIA